MRRAFVLSLAVALSVPLLACRRSGAPQGAPPDAMDPSVAAAASSIARALVGPPPAGRPGAAAQPLFAVRVACPGAGPCAADLTDDAGSALGHWDFAHLPALGAALREHHVVAVVLSADPDVPYASVIQVMDAAREAGVTDVTFAAPSKPH